SPLSFTAGPVVATSNPSASDLAMDLTIDIHAPVILNSSTHTTTFTGKNISFHSTIRANTSGVENLAVHDAGTTTLMGNLGTTANPLRSVNFGAGGKTLLGADINTKGGRVAFSSPLDVTHNVLIDRKPATDDVNSGPLS